MKLFHKYLFDIESETYDRGFLNYNYKIGDFVKVSIPGFSFWIIITKIDCDTLFGLVDNNVCAQLNYGEMVVFSKKLVITVMPD